MHHPPEEQIGYLLKRLGHLFRHALEERLRRSAEISFGHLVTLDQIHTDPGIAGAQLARNLFVTAQTMTDLLKRLEREGSIERRPNPHNRRTDSWYLLPAGQERLVSARQAGGPVMTQMLSLLSPEDVSQLRRSLERCVEGLESAASQAPRPRARKKSAPRRSRTVRRTA